MDEPLAEALGRMDSVVDGILFLLEDLPNKFDREKYERAVAKLRFLASKYPAVAAQAQDGPTMAQVAQVEGKIKLATKLVRDVKAKWVPDATADSSPRVAPAEEAEVAQQELPVLAGRRVRSSSERDKPLTTSTPPDTSTMKKMFRRSTTSSSTSDGATTTGSGPSLVRNSSSSKLGSLFRRSFSERSDTELLPTSGTGGTRPLRQSMGSISIPTFEGGERNGALSPTTALSPGRATTTVRRVSGSNLSVPDLLPPPPAPPTAAQEAAAAAALGEHLARQVEQGREEEQLRQRASSLTLKKKRISTGGSVAREELEEAPPATFDTIVQRERKLRQSVTQEGTFRPLPSAQADGSNEGKPNPWKAVTLLGVARFDYEGDPSRKVLPMARGDGFLITGEAREWYRGRRVDSRSAPIGLIPAHYLEPLTQEEALSKLMAAFRKIHSMREERDSLHRAYIALRDKVVQAVESMRETAAARSSLEQRVHAQAARIAELEAQLATVGGVVKQPEETVESRKEDEISSLQEEASEMDSSVLQMLLAELEESPRSKAEVPATLRRRVPLFGSPLHAICEADNSDVPLLVERICSHMLKNNAEGLKVPGIFRLAASKQTIDDAMEALSVNLNADLGQWDFIVVGDVLKTFLRMLHEPLLTHELFPRWILASKIKSRAIQVPYVRSLLASLPPENVALVEFLCNFIVIAIQYEESSMLTLSNASLLFAPVFLSHDTRIDLSSDVGGGVKKSGFTPLFSRRKPSVGASDSAASLANQAKDLKEKMSAGIAVLQTLLINFSEIWLKFHQTARPFTLYKAKKDSGPPKTPEDLEFKKGAILAVFLKVDSIHGLGECGGKVGRFQLALCKVVEIS